MAKEFDPYHVWLGIPPKDQPPNHYRLLGIELFEDHSDVIDAAANRQNSYLHEMAAGPNRKHSQKLMTEIAAARRCLLNDQSREKYDETLRAMLAADGESAGSTPSAPGTASVSFEQTDTKPGQSSEQSSAEKSADSEAEPSTDGASTKPWLIPA